jgi:phosphoribosylformylglycinamidine synthase
VALVIGGAGTHLGQSALMWDVWGRAEGAPPPVDLAAERRNGEFLLAQRALIRAATDLSDGGLALAAFEMAAGAGVGVALDAADLPALYGEDQGRYLVACAPDAAQALLAAGQAAGVPVAVVGRFGGAEVRLGGSAAPLAGLDALWRGAFAAAMGEGAAAA